MNELIEKARNGDKDAFSEIYSASRKDLYRYCRNLCGNDSDAQDLMQQTCLRAWQKIPEMKSENVSSWLRSVARSIFLNNLKKSNEYFIEEYPEIPDNSQNPEFIAEKRDICRILLKALKNSLSPVQKMTVILYYYDEKSVSEIARIMHCSVGTVESRLYYARKKLREELKKFGNIFTCLSLGFAVIKHKLKNIHIPVNARITVSAVMTAAAMVSVSMASIPPENKFPDTVIKINETGISESQTTRENKTVIQTSSETAFIEPVSHATTNSTYTIPTSESRTTAFKSEYEEIQNIVSEESEEGDTEKELTEENDIQTEYEEVTTMKKEIIAIATAATMALTSITTIITTAVDEPNNSTSLIETENKIKVVIWAKNEDISSYAEEKAYQMTSEYADTLNTNEFTYYEIEKMKTDYYKEKKRELLKQAYCERAELILDELEIDKKTASYSSFTPMIVCSITEEQMKKAETYELVSSVSIYEPIDDAQDATVTTPCDSILSGDVNLDDIVTISDSVLILQHLVNSEKYPLSEQAKTNADCCNTGDGITGLDAAAIQKFDAGIIDFLPETLS